MTQFAQSFIDVVGVLTTVFAIALFIWTIISWCLGVFPLFLRLGFGRWIRKIAIVANDEKYASLKSDLVDTGIFREKNIYQIKNDALAKVKDATLALVHYQSFTEAEVNVILANKKADAGFIFYFPEFTPPATVIPLNMMKAINNHPFTIIVNTRGRLINDIVTTLLSIYWPRFLASNF